MMSRDFPFSCISEQVGQYDVHLSINHIKKGRHDLGEFNVDSLVIEDNKDEEIMNEQIAREWERNLRKSDLLKE